LLLSTLFPSSFLSLPSRFMIEDLTEVFLAGFDMISLFFSVHVYLADIVPDIVSFYKGHYFASQDLEKQVRVKEMKRVEKRRERGRGRKREIGRTGEGGRVDGWIGGRVDWRTGEVGRKERKQEGEGRRGERGRRKEGGEGREEEGGKREEGGGRREEEGGEGRRDVKKLTTIPAAARQRRVRRSLLGYRQGRQ
jgi:hypothetical protein